MKRLILTLMVLLIVQYSYSQSSNESRKGWEFFKKGNAKSEEGDYKGAIIDYTTAIENNPKLDLAYFFRGLAKNNLEDHRGAINDFTKAISLTDWSQKVRLSEAYNNRGISKGRLKDYTGAISDFTECIKLENDASSYYNRGIMKINLNQKNSGCLDLSKAGELGYPKAYEAIKNFCN